VRVNVHTHIHVLLSGYVLTHIPVPILANILLRTRAYTYVRTHIVSHVTHTRHTIVVDTSSEKREVDSLHHEKQPVHLFSLELPCLLACLLQPVPWKMRLEMVIGMQIEILNGIMKLPFYGLFQIFK